MRGQFETVKAAAFCAQLRRTVRYPRLPLARGLPGCGFPNAVAAKPDDLSGPLIKVAPSAQNLDTGIDLRGPLAWHDTNGGRLANKLKDKDAVPEGVQDCPVVAHTDMRYPGVVIAKRVKRIAEARAIPSLTVSKDIAYGNAAAGSRIKDKTGP